MDNKIATDHLITNLRTTLQKVPNSDWSCVFRCTAQELDQVLNRLDAAEEERDVLKDRNAALEGDPELSDDECFRAMEMVDRTARSAVLAAHRAQRETPLRHRIAELESENAALRAKLAPGVSDREFLRRLFDGEPTMLKDSGEPFGSDVELLATHVASRTAPLEQKLGEAVECLRRIVDYVNSPEPLMNTSLARSQYPKLEWLHVIEYAEHFLAAYEQADKTK